MTTVNLINLSLPWPGIGDPGQKCDRIGPGTWRIAGCRGPIMQHKNRQFRVMHRIHTSGLWPVRHFWEVPEVLGPDAGESRVAARHSARKMGPYGLKPNSASVTSGALWLIPGAGRPNRPASAGSTACGRDSAVRTDVRSRPGAPRPAKDSVPWARGARGTRRSV
jgi:hypothetical protein